MHPNQATVEAFYHAFAALDAETMAACYAADARFQDAVFTLEGKHEVAAMWRMLCRGVRAGARQDWKLDYNVLRADGRHVGAHWVVRYHFGATGHMVHNRVDASFVFDRTGRIAQHHDVFDFWRWSRQALGTPGLLLGWSPLLRQKVRANARRKLDTFLAEQANAVAA